MNKIKNIAFDLDGVLWSAGDAVSLIYNNEFKNRKEADFSKCLRWDMKDIMPLATMEWMEEVFNSSEFFDNVVLFDGIKELIYNLHDKGYNILFVSRCGVKNARYKLSYLDKIFPFAIHLPVVASWDSILDKDLINLKNSIFIDDKKSNLDSSNADYKILFNEHGNYEVEWAKGWEGFRADSVDNLEWIIALILEQDK